VAAATQVASTIRGFLAGRPILAVNLRARRYAYPCSPRPGSVLTTLLPTRHAARIPHAALSSGNSLAAHVTVATWAAATRPGRCRAFAG
jgi:hypothetical protein